MIFSSRRHVDILGIRVDDVTYGEALSLCHEALREGGQHQIVTPNAEFAVLARRDHAFRQIINESYLSIPDGHSLLWATRLLGRPLREQVTGTDLAYGLAELASKEGYRLFLLGAAQGVAEIAAGRLRERYPGLHIAGTYAGSPAGSDEPTIRERLDAAGRIDILLVAYGAPAQDKWIARNLPELGVGLAMGIGGVLDFMSGRVRRAPRWLRDAGFDWLFRLALDPRRWRRQLTIPQFFLLVGLCRLKGQR